MDSGLMQEGLIGLNEGEVLRLRDAAGRHLAVARGTAWVTQENDPRDRIVGRGESFRFERDGLSLVVPLGGTAGIVLEDGLSPAPGKAPETRELDWDELLDLAPVYERRARRLRAQAFADLVAAAGRALKALPARLSRSLSGALRARRTASQLHALSDHILRDIGLRRDQIDCVARRIAC
jgi:uncharacterized protein YjiS (DUF1127 family)